MPNTGAPPGGPDDRSAARANAVILNRSSPLSLFLMDTLVVEAGLVALLAFRGVAALPVLATCIVSSDAVVLFQSLLLGNRSPAMRTKRGRSVSTTGTKSFHFAIRWWRSLVMMSFIGWGGSQDWARHARRKGPSVVCLSTRASARRALGQATQIPASETRTISADCKQNARLPPRLRVWIDSFKKKQSMKNM
jgi:hypothetical protein